ncbi:MAG: hypothetical protein ACP5I4_10075 [Oceanipulchritudo sp.]
MSLINEALKKAQTQRPFTRPVEDQDDPSPPSPQAAQHPPRRRGYLWGFIIALVFVGLLSSGTATFLVWQILGTNGEGAAASPSSDTAVPETAASPPAPAEPSEATPLEPSTAVASVAPSAEAEPAAGPVQDVVGKSAAGDEPRLPGPPVAARPAVETPRASPLPPNPAVWARMEELEIRGIMSGGNKVLIHDTSNGKTKAYEPGDLLDGSLGLKIASISPNTIVFEDYGGVPHTKSF